MGEQTQYVRASEVYRGTKDILRRWESVMYRTGGTKETEKHNFID